MKYLIAFLTIFTILAASTNAQEKKEQKSKKTKTVTFTVNMDCQGCIDNITKELSFTKGVKDLDISLEKKTVRIDYRPKKTSPTTLKKTITDLGYLVEEKGQKKRPVSNKKETPTIHNYHQH